MTDNTKVKEIMDEAEKYRFLPDLLELVEKLIKMNPKMDKLDATKIAFDHFKTQSKLGARH